MDHKGKLLHFFPHLVNVINTCLVERSSVKQRGLWLEGVNAIVYRGHIDRDNWASLTSGYLNADLRFLKLRRNWNTNLGWELAESNGKKKDDNNK